MAWLALVGTGGRWWASHPRSPPKRRHFTPNPVKRPVFLRFGVKCQEKSFEIPPRLVTLPVLEGVDCVSDVGGVDQAPQDVVVEVGDNVLAALVHGSAPAARSQRP
ncbi:hypothetical protein CIP107541_01843 [Corynebacterium diphtheriae]|nr:hypothetical protein CIP107541_01843 [Corynebacterium diphtheriae]VEJ64520.1 nucleosidase [Corynebacterium diphtheriae]